MIKKKTNPDESDLREGGVRLAHGSGDSRWRSGELGGVVAVVKGQRAASPQAAQLPFSLSFRSEHRPTEWRCPHKCVLCPRSV